MKNLKFKLYNSGIYLADFHFGKENIFHRYRDIYNDTWSLLEAFNDNNDEYKKKYNLDVEEIKEILSMCNNLDFTSLNEFRIKNRIYKKHTQVQGESLDHTAVIWAERHKKIPLDIVTVNKEVIGFILTKREECTVLVLEGYEKLTPNSMWNDSSISQDKSGIRYLATQMINMRDGIKLATDVWIPNGKTENSTFPTILVRTPYGKDITFQSFLKYVKRGYALVVQDTRGREESEGEFEGQGCERADGDDTLNWIYEQSWCDGNIGMIGGSYLGYVQWAAASSGNPHLKAIISIVTAGSPFIDLPRKGGTLSSGILAWVFAMSKKKFNPQAMMRDDWNEIIKIRPIKDIPQKIFGYEIPYWNKIIRHSANDNYWSTLDWSQHGDKINVPSLIVSGWFDDNGQGSLEAWKMNMNNNRKNIKMILGPWLHKANTTRDIGEIAFGNNAIRYDLDIIYQKWFDKYLKGVDNKIDLTPTVEYYQQGENQWRAADTWAPKNAIKQNLYLDSNGNANGSSGDGKLIWERVFHKEFDSYLYDPNNPVPHLIDISENELNVPANYKDIEKRIDVLVYTSDVLEDDVTVVGEVSGEIYAVSSAKDTDWVVRLTDVDENGNSKRLVDGLYRARYLEDFKKEKLLEDGEVRKYVINMFHTANTFKKGHRIRIEVTSSAENLTFPNHNTGNDISTDTEYLVAHQKILHSTKYPSHIKLHILK